MKYHSSLPWTQCCSVGLLLDAGIEDFLCKLADITKLGRIANTLEDRNIIQKYLDR